MNIKGDFDIKGDFYFVESFVDHHEIRSSNFTCLELGCFPISPSGKNLYFGLFWSGKKPSAQEVMKVLADQISWENIEESEVLNRISLALEQNGKGPSPCIPNR